MDALTWLRGRRRSFRVRRLLQRMLSPRRVVASSLTVLFVVAYLLNGIYILAAREPADPRRLVLWLSGGMVIYGIYYCVRCAWSTKQDGLELSPAETVWLAGAPISSATLTIHHVVGLAPAALAKTGLLAVVLARDVEHIEFLMIGVFTSLLLLEIVRTTIAVGLTGLSSSRHAAFRGTATAVAAAAVVLALATVAARTPLRSPTWVYVLSTFHALGEVAASPAIQWLSLPWIAGAKLAVAPHYAAETIVLANVSLGVIPAATWVLVRVRYWSEHQATYREFQALQSGHARRSDQWDAAIDFRLIGLPSHWFYHRLPPSCQQVLSIASRHWVSVRRYRWTIIGSFVVPTLICLSPLVTGTGAEQWLYVIGGVAICTMLLAPPALKIDFRRDLRRMLLVRSLPVGPAAMVLGTLLPPVLITWVFQWVTIAIAAVITSTDFTQVVLWTALMNALAVFAFAGENALFLAYPHHEKAEGIGMMIRAKLTFLGKGSVMAAALTLLFLWAVFCRSLPEPIVQPLFISGAVTASWLTAAAALAAATWCWRRFDASVDVPPL